MVTARFNGLIVFLTVTGLGSAFLLPPRTAAAVRQPFEGLFSPVSIPARAVTSRITQLWARRPVVDEGSPAEPRAAADVYAENRQLRAEVARLQLEDDRLAQTLAERKIVGDVGGGAESATVTGVDSSGHRDGIMIAGANYPKDGAVVSGHDLVGRIYGGGVAGAEVQLVTDKGMRFTVRIGKYIHGDDGTTKLKLAEHLTPLVQGAGHGQMEIVTAVSMQQALDAHVEAGDVVLLDDRDKWPAGVQGLKVGRVTAVRPQAKAPLSADIVIEPETDLFRLSEVMVLSK